MSTAAGRLLLDSRKIFPDVVVLRLRPPHAQTLSWYSASVSLGGACWGRGAAGGACLDKGLQAEPGASGHPRSTSSLPPAVLRRRPGGWWSWKVSVSRVRALVKNPALPHRDVRLYAISETQFPHLG